ncbi:MAG: hypothetical protein ACKVGW_17740 [Verrucomicrobiia bacterium]|jgi:hypothetical protein|tara:strand:+ start:71 stop:298 length:228 start_codon:yes stop_codon:yes gene_type:complete
MKFTSRLFIVLSLFAAKAAAHPTVLPHGHPHTDEAGALNSTLAIGGLALIAGAAWFANWKLSKKAKVAKTKRFHR